MIESIEKKKKSTRCQLSHRLPVRIPNVPSQVVAPRETVTTMRAHVLPIHQSLPFGPGAVVGKDVPLHVALPRRPAVALRRDGAEHERADDGLDVDPEVLPARV